MYIVHVLVAGRFGLWTMMAELCFSVDNFILFVFSKTAADTASEYDSYGHRRCWTAAASWPYYSSRRRAKPVGIVLPCVLFSYSLLCALVCGRGWKRSVFRLTILFEQFVCYQQYSSRHHKQIRQLRAPSLLNSSGFVPLLLLPAPVSYTHLTLPTNREV